MKSLPLALAAALSLTFTPALAQDAEPPMLPAEIGTVLATVNGTDITLGHALALYQNLPAEYQQISPAQILPALVDQLIDQELLAADAAAAGLISEEVVAIVVENERRALLANRELSAGIADVVTEEALMDAHAAIIAGMEETPEFNASHILVETEERAVELVTELADGADFATLAQENSIGPSAPRGGNLGWFGPGQMVPSFDAAVQDLAVGEVSAPVQTQFGWHVVLLNDKRLSPLPTLADMREELTTQLRQGAVRDLIEGAREGADIVRVEGVVDPEALSAIELYAQ
ncbi:MAG: peptidylprolyl isomerase [Pseudomonadota bacterium]